MKLKIEIDCGNDVLAGDNRDLEIARILTKFCNLPDLTGEHILHDINGNRVGTAVLR